MAEEADDYVVDWAEKAAGLVEMARDEQEWYEAVAAALVRPGDQVAVDAGCGAGGMTGSLAVALAAALPATGPDGRAGGGTAAPAPVVVAVDGEPDLLAAVRELVGDRSRRQALARVELVCADLGEGVGPVAAALPAPADLVWASASVHHVGDQQALLDALAALLRPGGRLALAEGGLVARHLPWDLGVGEPGLESRLEVANDRWFTRMRAELPGSVRMPYGWAEALRRTGLAGVTTRSTVRELPTPLSADDRRQVVDRLTRWVDRLRSTGGLDRADVAAWDRLLDPADPAWLGHRDDLFRLDVRSVHVGTRPH